jgi:putative addiction module component (TIGR02574 family)
MSTEEILAEVLRLPRTERARLAEEVLSSLEEAEEEVVAAWARELERRSREISEGRVQAVDWETARKGILRELGRHACDTFFILKPGPHPHLGSRMANGGPCIGWCVRHRRRPTAVICPILL